MSDIYTQLRERLDTVSTGFPSTKSGIEIRILKKLFSEDDAALYLQLGPMLESPADAAARLSRDPDDLARHMEDMARRGLLFRLRKGDAVRYSAVPFVIGIMEYQLKRIDRGFAKEMEDYFQAGFGPSLRGADTPLMRTVPINRAIAPEFPVAIYDDVMKTIDEQKSIMVADCICRRWGRLIENGCDMPLEACFLFGSQADYYVENGLGRYVTPAEAKAIVRKNLDEAPLVIQMANTQKGGGFCMCCGDCCAMLRSLKLQPKPSEAVKSNYRAVLDNARCTACGACVDRCQMGALTESGEAVSFDGNRCIGCGNCLIACPSDAIRLEKKSDRDIYTPPENFMLTYLSITRERNAK